MYHCISNDVFDIIKPAYTLFRVAPEQLVLFIFIILFYLFFSLLLFFHLDFLQFKIIWIF